LSEEKINKNEAVVFWAPKWLAAAMQSGHCIGPLTKAFIT